MEHFGQPRPSTSRVITNDSLSPTNSPLGSPRTRSRHSSLPNHHDKGSAASWRNPNPPTGYLSPPPQSSLMPSFGLVSTSSSSPSNPVHSSLPSVPTGLHQGINGLAYQQGPGSSHHVFGSNKSIFGSLHVQHKMPSHRNVEHEEAMDIDTQDDMDIGGQASSVGPMASQSKTLRSDASLTNLESPKKNDTHTTIRSWKQLTLKSKVVNKPTKADKPSSSEETSKPSKGTAKKRAIYIVMHVSRVTIGTLHAKASAPVKIYAEKVFLEVELDDHTIISLKIPCKDFTHCTVSFELPKPMIVFTLSKAAIKSILASNKNQGNFLDPEQHEDNSKDRIVLLLNSTSLTREVRQDFTELFQKRLANQITWKEVSSSEMNSLLGLENKPAEQKQEKDAPCSKSQDSETTNKPSPTAATPPRKILTPKKSRVKKGVFPESSPSSSDSSSTDTSTSTNTVTQSSSKTTCNATIDTQENKIVTRSRRRKADAATKDPSSPPKTPTNDARDPVGKAEGNTKHSANNDKKSSGGAGEETTERDTKRVTVDSERDLLHHHSKMESHITLLGQHSEKQRHSLEHHQKLLTLEREERSRSFEKIQELQSTNRENQQFLRQQNETIDMLNREIDNQKLAVLQLRQELGQEREVSSRMRKVQTDLIQARGELEEEKVVRGIRDKQLLEKENELSEVRRVCTEERSLRQGLNEELQRVQNACVQHMDELENQRLFRQTQDRELQGREDRIQENERKYQDEHAVRLSLEDELRRLRIENDDLLRSRDAAQNDLRNERQGMCQEREAFNQERQNYDQRLRDGESTISDCERRIRELQAALSTSQGLMEENRRIEPRDWIIRREEVTTSDRVLGTGAWGTVKVGVFRGSKVAVKQIHELILSPHNRRLFEREMSIASRCRHPCLLQFIGATNDDGIPLFLTEILDTDLRAVLSRRSLHQEEIIAIALDIARSLNYLHLSKPFPIVHRDISSSNVLLWKRDTCWRAKLSDYGAANFMRQCMTVNPGAGIYAAPEASTSQQSTKVDIYSFGLLLCEMCIRELPVPQQTQEQVNLVTNGVLRELVMRCVHTDPETRPTMAEVITLLEQQEENLVQSGLVSVNGRTASI